MGVVLRKNVVFKILLNRLKKVFDQLESFKFYQNSTIKVISTISALMNITKQTNLIGIVLFLKR
jgi:hypothetical protein